jgi:hypothetical protein
MTRFIWTSCIVVLLHTLTGCTCCNTNCGSQGYSNCLPCNNGCGGTSGGSMLGGGMMSGGGDCCGDGNDFSLPPSPYANQQLSQMGQQRTRMRQRTVGPIYSNAPSANMSTQMDNGSMYESFGSEVMPDAGMQAVPNDSGWQPKSATPMPNPAPVPETGPSAYSTPSAIPTMSASQIQVPAPPVIYNNSPQVQSNIVGPDMGQTPPPLPEPISRMGYRRLAPIQRAF